MTSPDYWICTQCGEGGDGFGDNHPRDCKVERVPSWREVACTLIDVLADVPGSAIKDEDGYPDIFEGVLNDIADAMDVFNSKLKSQEEKNESV